MPKLFRIKVRTVYVRDRIWEVEAESDLEAERQVVTFGKGRLVKDEPLDVQDENMVDGEEVKT